jgi:AcrR family transcriptional regulator
MMTAPISTTERILDGAVRALEQHGLRKVSMSDIGHEAGVSRGTLYRYFPHKDAVLEAIGFHVRDRFLAVVRDAAARSPEPADRLRAVMDVLTARTGAHPAAGVVLRSEPEFAIAFMRRQLPGYVEGVRDALHPVLAELAVDEAGELELAELVFRLGISTHFLPSDDPGAMVDRIVELWEALRARARELAAAAEM